MSDLELLPALIASALIVALSAFFVAVEFSLVAARRHRLEVAAQDSLAARAALRSSRDLSLLLAGSQLGITICLVALGAIAKPAMHHLLSPAITSIGAPRIVADVAGFVLALVIVTFIHLVVGEMAPKSWAIAHPEKSAIMLAIPMRAFMWVTRPILLTLNGLANRCLRLVGVEPVDEVAVGQGPDALRELVDHSATAGTLDEGRRRQLAAALAVNTRPVSEVVTPLAEVAGVDAASPVAEIKAAATNSGHLRLVVRRAGQPVGVVHARDTIGRDDATAAQLMSSPIYRIPATTPIYQALTIMRENHVHVALAVDADEQVLGLIALQDLVDELLAAQFVTS
jgi:CBS domain containing-hemolysin-like protein